MRFSAVDESNFASDLLTYKSVGQELHEWRVQAGRKVTMSEAAKVAGVHRATYSNWESGLAAPDLVQAARLKAGLGWQLGIPSAVNG